MGKIDDSARLIIQNAYTKLKSKSKIAEIYQIPLTIIDFYLLDVDIGSLWGRQVVRVEMSRVKAEKDKIKDWKASESDQYKGGRNQ